MLALLRSAPMALVNLPPYTSRWGKREQSTQREANRPMPCAYTQLKWDVASHSCS